MVLFNGDGKPYSINGSYHGSRDGSSTKTLNCHG
jgi:hypothetical protein